MNFIKTTEKNKKQEIEITKLLELYANDTEVPISNFNLAKYYDSIDHRSAAISFYIRCAERSDDTILQYSSLIRAAECFEKEGYRGFTVNSLVKNALLIDIERPEAYFYLCNISANKAKNSQNAEEQATLWHDCYMYSCLGLKFADKNFADLCVSTVYPGKYGLIFMKALSSWHCGMPDQSKYLFQFLLNTFESVMTEHYKAEIIENLKRFN